jgi:hypothetical protein
MRIQQALGFSVGLLLSSCVLMRSAQADRPMFVNEEERKRAEDLHQEGKALMKAGKYAEALGKYSEAYRLDETFSIAANIGQLELLLGRPRDAAEHMAQALRLHGKEAKPEAVAALQRNFELAKQEIGALRVVVNPADADVRVDGRWYGWMELSEEIFVDPGAHAIEAKQKSYRVTQQTITLGKGERQELRLRLEPVAAPPAAPALPPEVPASEAGSGKSLPLLITGAGLALTGVALGTGFTLRANSQLSGALVLRDDLVHRAGRSACAAPTGTVATDCGRLRDQLVGATTFSSAAVWSFVGAGAFAVATMAYGVWPGGRGGKRGPGVKAHVAPLLGGFEVVGTF